MDMLDRIYSWSVQQLWDELVRIKDDQTIPEFNNIKLGYDIPFHINLYFKYLEGDSRYMKERHKSGDIWIGYQTFRLYDFFDEVDRRKSAMRTALKDFYTKEKDKTVDR